MFNLRRRIALALGVVLSAAAWGSPAGNEASAAMRSVAMGDDAPRRFALVIGSNHTLDDSQAPLRFADDDAARVAELLVETGVDTELVTHLDRDSQALFPELVPRTHRPDDDGLQTAFDALRGRMEAAKDQGQGVELLIYYSGHGDVGPDGQGFLTLDGAKLTRKKLFGKLLSRSPADHNHVIIDACRSEQFVLSRGKDWKPDRAEVDLSRSVQRYLDKNHLGAHPNTGVILAHSADQQTHEWDRYRGGIFTHELLSGLRGGADLNGDSAIEYSELGAFVSAANHGVDDPRARLEVVVRPPADDERIPVLTHGRLSDKRVLLFEPGDRHHYIVEDARGVRLADVRRSGEQYGYLRIPDGELFVGRSTSATDREETQVEAGQRGVMRAGDLRYAEAASGSRGSLDQAFRRGLFSIPFGPGYYAGYTAQRGLLTVAEPDWQGPTTGTSPTMATPIGPRPSPVAIDAEHEGSNVIVIDSEGGTVTIEQNDGQVEIHDEDEDEDEDDDDIPAKIARHLDSSRPYGGIFLGVPVTPFSPGGGLSTTRKRVTANEMEACLSAKEGIGCRQIRGIDLRWQLFRVGEGKRFPKVLGYFRSGYESGRTTFDRDGGLLVGQASALSYIAVPLYFGGNYYLFDQFPLRPYGGLGLGLDVIRLDYSRANSTRLLDTVARPGFEFHAGLELRITNYVSLTGEIKQQWSARKKIDGVPDFANEGVTITTGIAIGFPLRPGRR